MRSIMNAIIALVPVLIVLGNIQVCHGLLADENDISLRHEEAPCKVEEIAEVTSPVEVICPLQEGNHVPHQGSCNVVYEDAGPERYSGFTCQDGQWIYTGTDIDVAHHRERRGLIAAILTKILVKVAATLIVYTICYLVTDNVKCEKTDDPQQATNNPPSYSTCPPSDLNPVGVAYIAEKGNDYKVVTWSDPVATDDKEIIKNAVTGPKSSGDQFAGSETGVTHSIIYEATDNNGAKAYCQFSFQVKYIACSRLARPDNARMSCSTNKDLYGTLCTITCASGYELNPQGDGVVECQESGQWTTPPTCGRVSCPSPSAPDNGYLVCDHDTEHRFGDKCVTFCNEGYQRDKEGLSISECLANRTWSVPFGTVKCIDASSPTISCVSPQIFYADRGITSTTITWVEPTANDTVDSFPAITHVSGPQQGAELSVGEHIVTYRATDANGNTDPNLSECNTTIIVEVVNCEHPSDALEMASSTQGVFMEYNCTKDSFYHGVECTLGCRLNVLLNGSDTMTCERNDTGPLPTGYWYWASDIRPFCGIVDCPPLTPPVRGAMVSESVNARPLRVMVCQAGYDVSSVTSVTGTLFTGSLRCLDSGEWFPLQSFPDCIQSIIPNLKLLNELLYYDGNCSDISTQTAIKHSVLSFLAATEADIHGSLCPNGTTCALDNLKVTCGASSRKRRAVAAGQTIERQKRAAGEVTIVTWDVVIPLDIGNGTIHQAYAAVSKVASDISDEIGKRVSDGMFDINGFSLKDDSFQKEAYASVGCPPAYKFDNSGTCKPCPSGTFLNATSGDCEYCHVGEYMDHDGAVECDVCPVGYSTLLTGSKDISACLKLCDAGFYSPTTMSPCSPCPVGTYQSSSGMTSCVSCPADMTTRSTNSTSADACSLFDLQVKGVTTKQRLATLTPPTGDTITLAFWTKPTSPSSPDVQLTLSTGSHTILTLHLKENINVEVGGAVSETHVFSNEIWNHVICVINIATGSVDLYVNGHQSTRMFAAVDIQQTRSPLLFDIQSSSKHGLYLSRITFHSRAPSSTEISTLSGSCAGTIDDTIFTMEQIKQLAIEGVIRVTPSSCDAVDGCKDQPCGNHTCIDERNGFTCVCSGGWSGDTCSVAPDYCKDNLCHHGDCVPGNGLYTCSCRDGYTGVFCDTPPVDGSWSDWLGWFTCTTSCDGGTRNRTRSCDNPAPGPHGADCQGDSVQTEACNTHTCPSCDPLHRASGTTVTCTDDTSAGLTRCNMTCLRGRFLPNGQRPYKEYTCGADTGYSWSPTDELPECAVAAPPSFLSTVTTAEYDQTIPATSQESFKQTVTGNLPELPCTQSGSCTQTVAISSTNSRRKRSTGSTITITLNIPLTQTGDLELEAAAENGTISPRLQELIDAYNNTAIAQAAVQSNSSTIFNVQANGIQYTIAANGVTTSVHVTCPSGHTGTDGVCVPCSAGTRLEAGVCVDCEIGTYQPDTAQDTCVACPSGYTTTYLGSTDMSQCSVTVDVTSPVSTSNTDSGSDAQGFQHWMIAVIVVGTVLVFVLGGIIGICIYKHVSRNNVRRGRRGSRVSVSMVVPNVPNIALTEKQKMEQLIDIENEDNTFRRSWRTDVTNTRFTPTQYMQPPSYDSHSFAN